MSLNPREGPERESESEVRRGGRRLTRQVPLSCEKGVRKWIPPTSLLQIASFTRRVRQPRHPWDGRGRWRWRGSI